MQKAIYISCLLISLLVAGDGKGQVTLNGPVCVTNNTVYLYTIAGSFDSSHTWQLCITGGHIEGAESRCVSGKWDPFIKVSWNSDSTGSMHLTSHSGSAVLQVNITTQLSGGTLDTNALIQVIDSTTTPSPIKCSLPSGGGCSPVYVYQWQQSSDNLQWTDVPGAISQNLEFSAPVQHSAYYRRKAKTQMSDAEAFTPVAAVFIKR